jgi:fructokinase
MEPAASTVETLIFREGKRKSADHVPVISFDPNIRPFMIKNKEEYIKRFEKWLAVCTIVKISSADFEFIYPGLSTEQAVKKTLSLGPTLVICTLGSKGALALLRGKDGKTISVSAPVVDLPVVDTIGAGDTFHGAFLSWLEINGKMSGKALEGLGEKDIYKALLFANKAASIVCSRRGADPPRLKEVEELSTLF